MMRLVTLGWLLGLIACGRPPVAQLAHAADMRGAYGQALAAYARLEALEQLEPSMRRPYGVLLTRRLEARAARCTEDATSDMRTLGRLGVAVSEPTRQRALACAAIADLRHVDPGRHASALALVCQVAPRAWPVAVCAGVGAAQAVAHLRLALASRELAATDADHGLAARTACTSLPASWAETLTQLGEPAALAHDDGAALRLRLAAAADMAYAHAVVGLVAELLAQPTRAAFHFGAAYAISPIPTYAWGWARSLGALGQVEQAEVLATRAAAALGEPDVIGLEFAAILARAGQPDAARRAWKLALPWLSPEAQARVHQLAATEVTEPSGALDVLAIAVAGRCAWPQGQLPGWAWRAHARTMARRGNNNVPAPPAPRPTLLRARART